MDSLQGSPMFEGHIMPVYAGDILTWFIMTSPEGLSYILGHSVLEAELHSRSQVFRG